MKSLLLLALSFSALSFGLFAPNTFADPNVQVVMSTPIETNLAVPGVQATQAAWLELFNAAHTSIDLEQFYINNKAGESLEPVLNAIKQAAARGVQVRVLLDSKFFASDPSGGKDLASVANVQVKTIDFTKLGGIQHSKYFVIDGQTGYIGSANFDWLALTHIHEVGVRFNDASLGAGLESIFNLDWSGGAAVSTPIHPIGLPVLRHFASSVLELVASPPQDEAASIPNTLDALVALFNNAKTSIQIQMYEYNTGVYGTNQKWTVLDTAIRNAAARGVQVQMIVDRNALKGGANDIKALASVKNIQMKIITIPQWSGGPLSYARLVHSKFCIIDKSTGWVGSENWSSTYFTGSRNVGTITTMASLVGALDQIHSTAWNSAYVTKP